MIETLQQVSGTLGKWTIYAFGVCLVSFCVATIFALLGFPHVVAGFRAVMLSAGVIGVAGFMLILLGTIVGAVSRWLDRRSQQRV